MRKLIITAIRLLREQSKVEAPEQRLYWSLLEQSIRDAFDPYTPLRDEARLWFVEDDGDHIVPFGLTVEALGLDPAYVRSILYQVNHRRIGTGGAR